MPTRTELVAHNRTTPEIAHTIGADLVIFQTLPDLVSSVQLLNPAIQQFDCSVFTGEYVTGGVDEKYLEGLERTRADNVKARLGRLGIREREGVGLRGESVDTSGWRTPKEVVGGLGALEGKGGGGIRGLTNERKEVAMAMAESMANGANGSEHPNHGTDEDEARERQREREWESDASMNGNAHGGDTIGLHNSWKAS